VTVPARVKVQVANIAVGADQPGESKSTGLALSINATQRWSLSIDAPSDARLRWSGDGESGFTALDPGQSIVTSETRGPIRTARSILVRSSAQDSRKSSGFDGDATPTVLLTIVAQ
jgi:hypothetical protein